MGDGRYYTSEQFFSIIYLTLLIIFMTVNIMLCIYKGSKNKISKQVLLPIIVVSIIAILNFVEQVIVVEQGAFFVRYIIVMMFIGVNFLFIRFNLNYVSNSPNKINHSKLLKYFLYILMGVFLFISFFRRELLIKDYSFDYFEYGLVYLISCIVSLVWLLYIVLSVVINKNKNMNFKFNTSMFLLCSCLLWILPMIIYISAITLNIPNIKIVEFAIYLLISICLYVISGLFTPYRVSYSIFSDVRNLMLDYVFIIGEKGKIIYKNNRVEKAGIFRDIKSINIKDVSQVFDKAIINRDAYNKQFIKYLGENSIYFSYRKKPLKENEKIVGYIITFTDITELINMLDELREKQEHTLKANTNLSHYKDIVYNIEKEKEIYNLLDEIANNQQMAMIKLKHDIDNLNDNIDDDFIEKIAEIIAIAKLNLQDVREAVTVYMNYYGGEND